MSRNRGRVFWNCSKKFKNRLPHPLGPLLFNNFPAIFNSGEGPEDVAQGLNQETNYKAGLKQGIDLRGYGTQKYVDVHEKFHFLEIQKFRPLNTC